MRAALLVPALAALALSGSAAPAAADWSAPEQLPDAGTAGDLVADSDGGLVLTWRAHADSASWAQAPANERFSDAHALASSTPVRAAADGHGHVFMAWANADGVRFLQRGADAAQTIGSADVRGTPTIAADARGDVAVAWRQYADRQWFVRVAVRAAGETQFRPAVRLGSGTPAQAPVVAVAPGGDVAVAWFQNGSPRTLMTAIGDVTGAFADPVAVPGEAGSVVALQALVQGDGTVAVAWMSFAAQRSSLRAVSRPPGAAFGTPVTIATGGTSDADAVNGFGAGPLPHGWLAAYRLGESVHVREVGDTGPLADQTVEELAFDRYYRTAPAVATDPETGRGVVAWADGDHRVAVRRVLAGRTLAAGEVVSPAGPVVTDVRAAMGREPAVAWGAGAPPYGSDAVLHVARFAPPVDGGGGGGGSGGDRSAPRLSVRLPALVHATARFTLAVTASEHARLTVRGTPTAAGRRCGTIAAVHALPARRAARIVLTLPPAARRALRAGRTLRLALVLRARDDAGNVRVVRRTTRLHR